MKSSDSPAYAVSRTAVGMASRGAKLSKDHLLPTIPVIETTPHDLLGPALWSTGIMEKLDQGEAVDPASYYFRMNPLFETSAPKYDWMSRILAVGAGDRLADGPIYSIFEVLLCLPPWSPWRALALGCLWRGWPAGFPHGEPLGWIPRRP
jgi:Protein of unknown function (DUF3237)